MTTLTFQNSTLSVIHQNDQIWLSATELAKALGYKHTDGVTRIYNRNSDEFNDSMTAIIKNPQAVNLTVRIFSLRGCHLIGMLSHTKVAKDFRRWVLDILDKETEAPQQLALPEPLKFTAELTEHDLQQLVWAWFALTRGIDTMQMIYPAMDKLGSRYSGEIYGQGYEYLNVQREAHKILLRLTDGINADPMTN